eukprot:14210005-Alexandrium_andersonii.AAC.1
MAWRRLELPPRGSGCALRVWAGALGAVSISRVQPPAAAPARSPGSRPQPCRVYQDRHQAG